MGADSFINFYKWKNYKKILDKVPIIVVNRQNYNIKSLNSLTALKLSNLKSNFINNKNFKNKWTFLNTKGVSISSSEIRNKLNGS
jgi:nicotinate-nucleotide adenylyltransferase